MRPARLKSLTATPSRSAHHPGRPLVSGRQPQEAEERYLQAMRTAPDLAKPRVRLAQIAMLGAICRRRHADSRGRDRPARLDRSPPRYPGPLRRAGRVRPPHRAARISSADPSRRPRRVARPGRRVVPVGPNHQGRRCLQETQRPQPQARCRPGRLPRCLQPDRLQRSPRATP